VTMNRRHLLRLAPATLAVAAAGVSSAQPDPSPLVRHAIPRSGESLPVIGMGSWLTFDVGTDLVQQAQRRQVLQGFFAAGGGMIDSSPMYGRSQWLLGELLPSVPHEGKLFAATKVWTPFDRLGAGQLEQALALWRLARFDVLLVHNLLNWRGHLKLLRQWKEQGRVRYIGVSTSHGRRHDDLAQLIRSEPLDLIQITYNFADTRAEPVLNLAARQLAKALGRAGLEDVLRRPRAALRAGAAQHLQGDVGMLGELFGHDGPPRIRGARKPTASSAAARRPAAGPGRRPCSRPCGPAAASPEWRR